MAIADIATLREFTNMVKLAQQSFQSGASSMTNEMYDARISQHLRNSPYGLCLLDTEIPQVVTPRNYCQLIIYTGKAQKYVDFGEEEILHVFYPSAPKLQVDFLCVSNSVTVSVRPQGYYLPDKVHDPMSLIRCQTFDVPLKFGTTQLLKESVGYAIATANPTQNKGVGCLSIEVSEVGDGTFVLVSAALTALGSGAAVPINICEPNSLASICGKYLHSCVRPMIVSQNIKDVELADYPHLQFVMSKRDMPNRLTNGFGVHYPSMRVYYSPQKPKPVGDNSFETFVTAPRENAKSPESSLTDCMHEAYMSVSPCNPECTPAVSSITIHTVVPTLAVKVEEGKPPQLRLKLIGKVADASQPSNSESFGIIDISSDIRRVPLNTKLKVDNPYRLTKQDIAAANIPAKSWELPTPVLCPGCGGELFETSPEVVLCLNACTPYRPFVSAALTIGMKPDEVNWTIQRSIDMKQSVPGVQSSPFIVADSNFGFGQLLKKYFGKFSATKLIKLIGWVDENGKFITAKNFSKQVGMKEYTREKFLNAALSQVPWDYRSLDILLGILEREGLLSSTQVDAQEDNA